MLSRAFCLLGVGLILGASGCSVIPREGEGSTAESRARRTCSPDTALHGDSRRASSWLVRAQADVAAREYRASRAGEALQAPNRAHDLRTYFEPTGIRVHGRSAESPRLVGVSLAGVGRLEGPLVTVPPGVVSGEGERVEIRRAGLVEWYRNSPEGLEQGFDIAAPPVGQGALVLELSVTGAEASLQGDALVLRTPTGRRLSYGRIEARDAKGALLVARLAAPDPQRVRLVVEDAGAAYPLVIDPLLTEIHDARVESNQANANLGISVAGAGDVNGDGYADVIVGAYKYDSGQTDEGAAFVYLGGSTGIPDGGSAASLLQSNQAGSWLGSSVAGAGDVNGDGYDDLIVGAQKYAAGHTNEGVAFIFLGSSAGVVASGDPTTAHARLESNHTNGFFGTSVAGAGDVDGDGYGDVVVAANGFEAGAGETDEGAAFVFLGSSTGIPDGDPSTAHAQLEANQLGAGLSVVSGAGDVNGDGYDDVIVGASGYSAPETTEGAAFLFLGSSAGIGDGNPLTADALFQSDQSYSGFGSALTAGDFDGDGYDDVVVGAGAFDAPEGNEGAVFVFLGSSAGIGDGTPLTADAVFQSNQVGAFFGSVASAGDVAGDASDDLIIGAYLYDNGQLNEGGAFLFLGSESGIGDGDLTTSAAQLEPNQQGAYLGASLASAGDVDGDGSDDVIVGSHLYDAGQTNEGAAFVYLGDPRPPFVPPDLRIFDAPGEVTVTWTAPSAGIDRYIVHRYGNDGDYTFFEVDGALESFTDITAAGGVVHFYWVQAVNLRGEQSEFVQCSIDPGNTKGWLTGGLGPLPNPGFSVSPTGIAGDAATFVWEQSTAPTVTGYKIWSSASPVPLGSTTGLSLAATVSGLTTTTHLLTGLSPGTWYFRITATSSSSESNLASARQVAVVLEDR